MTEKTGSLPLIDCEGDELCTKCGGEGCFWGEDALGFDFVNDSPDELYDCAACGGSGMTKDQTIW